MGKEPVKMTVKPTKQSQSKNNKTKKQENFQKYLSFLRSNVQAGNRLLLESLTKTESLTYEQYSKEKFRQYIQNPKTNETNLRNMSQFLARVSMPYKRILWYYASIPLFRWHITPQLMNITDYDPDKLMEDYHTVAKAVSKMDLETEMRNVMYIALRDGVFYGITYEGEEDFFIHKLDPTYCKPVQIEGGVWNFAFDFSFFDKKKEYLEMWDPLFQTGYNAYQKDKKNMRWQIIDSTRSICIKADIEHELNIPFFLGVFEALIDLIDARTLQRNKDLIENYKLIIQKMPLFSNSQLTDDWALEVETIIQYYNMLANNVPENVGVALSPMEIDTVDFKPDDTNSDLIANSMRNVFNDSGVSEMLFNSQKSGSVGIDASIKTDISLSWTLVKSIERWIQRYINYNVDTNSYGFKFEILDVDIFNEDKAIKTELDLATVGVPNKMKLAATAGLSPIDIMSNQVFENDILQVHINWVPLQTSYTMSNNDIGRPASTEPNDSTDINKDADTNKDVV